MCKSYPIGLSVSLSSGNPLDENSFVEMKAGGIDFVELSEGNLHGYDAYNAAAIKNNALNSDVRLWSVHLPFVPFEKIDLSSLDGKIRNDTLNIFSEIIKKWSEIGIDKFIVHPSGEPISDDIREDRLKYSAESLSLLAEYAHSCGAVIAVEDLPRSCCGRDSEEIKYLIAGNDKLRVCFDTNHLLKEDATSFIKNVGNRIITTHISDYDFINERHWLPGEGDIKWQELLEALEYIGYNGPWLYEVSMKAPATINRRNLIYKDFYDNASALFKGEAPAPIGKRKENLGFWG